MDFFHLLSIIRGIIFIWVGATSYSVAQLYRDAYITAKKDSKIIRALTHILYWNTVMFSMLGMTAFSLALNLDFHRYITAALPLAAIPMGVLLIRFRRESITQQEK